MTFSIPRAIFLCRGFKDIGGKLEKGALRTPAQAGDRNGDGEVGMKGFSGVMIMV